MRISPDGPTSGWRRVEHLLNEKKAARVLLALMLGAVGSLPLVILTPPFQAPDEVQHFYRAYQLSEFHIRAEVHDGAAGGTLPDSLPQLVQASVYTRDGIHYPATPAPIARTLQLESIPLTPSKTRFVAFPGSAFYSPLPYVPQALGIAVGRAFGSGPLALLYCGRLFNCLWALGLLGLAVSIMPYCEELVLLAGLLPMSLYLYASISPDASVIGCALVFTALAISAGARGSWRTGSVWMAAAAGAIFCSVKPFYAPMLLAGMVPGIFRRGEAAKAIRTHAALLAVALGVTVSWLLFAKSTVTTPLSGAHPSAQIELALLHPMVPIHALCHTLSIPWLTLLYVQGTGVFGWLTVKLHPGIVYILPLAGLFLIWRLGVCGQHERSASRGFWYLALALASALSIMVALYLMWAQVGQADVPGVQGRYFIPILVLACMAAIEIFPNRRPPAPRWQSMAGMAAICIVQVAAMDTTIIRAFHIF